MIRVTSTRNEIITHPETMVDVLYMKTRLRYGSVGERQSGNLIFFEKTMAGGKLGH